MDTTFERVLGQFRADTSCDAQSVSGSDYFSREGQRYKHGENQPIASQVEQDWLAFGCSKSYWYTARISSSKPGSLEITISEPRRSPPPRSAAQLKEPPLRPGSWTWRLTLWRDLPVMASGICICGRWTEYALVVCQWASGGIEARERGTDCFSEDGLVARGKGADVRARMRTAQRGSIHIARCSRVWVRQGL